MEQTNNYQTINEILGKLKEPIVPYNPCFPEAMRFVDRAHEREMKALGEINQQMERILAH